MLMTGPIASDTDQSTNRKLFVSVLRESWVVGITPPSFQGRPTESEGAWGYLR